MRRIVARQIDVVAGGLQTQQIARCLAPDAAEYLCQHGFHPLDSARQLPRAIERLLIQPLTDLMITGGIAAGDRIFADDGKQLTFEQPPITIGRLSTHLLPIPNDTLVSSSHAKIDHDERGYVLEDRQSRNGTYLRDQKISGSVPLASGDLFRVGDTWLKFEVRG